VATLISAHGITKSFAGLTAVDNLDFEIEEREIFGLIGPNGSGKSTLVNVLTGFYKPDSGKVVFLGKEYGSWQSHNIARLGISRTFQNIRLFKEMSVVENVMVGYYMHACKANILQVLLGLSAAYNEENSVRGFAIKCIEKVGLNRSLVKTLAGNLSYAKQRLVEIARALATKPRLLILDEPAAGMNPTEINELRKCLSSLTEEGLSLLLIEHRMDLVMPLANKIMVMNFGKKITEGSPAEIQSNSEVLNAYLGRKKGRA